MDATLTHSSDVAFTPIGQGGAGPQGFAAAPTRRMEQRGGWRRPHHARSCRTSSRRRPASSSPPRTRTASPISSIAAARPASCACSTTRPSRFADFAGNRQYITQGNLADNPKAHLFLIDYAHRQRIKIWGEARVVEGDAAADGQADAGGLQGAARAGDPASPSPPGTRIARSTSRSASRPPTSPPRLPSATPASRRWKLKSRGCGWALRAGLRLTRRASEARCSTTPTRTLRG